RTSAARRTRWRTPSPHRRPVPSWWRNPPPAGAAWGRRCEKQWNWRRRPAPAAGWLDFRTTTTWRVAAATWEVRHLTRMTRRWRQPSIGQAVAGLHAAGRDGLPVALEFAQRQLAAVDLLDAVAVLVDGIGRIDGLAVRLRGL